VSHDDISPTMHDPRTQTQGDIDGRRMLEQYFNESAGSSTATL
jgi:hypothetical protein